MSRSSAGARWMRSISPPVLAQRQVPATGAVLSVCMMLLHRREEIPIADRLRLANTIVAEFIEGRRNFIPPLTD